MRHRSLFYANRKGILTRFSWDHIDVGVTSFKGKMKGLTQEKLPLTAELNVQDAGLQFLMEVSVNE